MPHLTTPRSSGIKPPGKSAPAPPESEALQAAFKALRSYDRGSSRAALLPIDEAVMAAMVDEGARNRLEARLVGALVECASFVAREYLCSKLALIGTATCAPALAVFLPVPELATAARNTLESIPGSEVSKILRDRLPKLTGVRKVGVISSIGARRDADSVSALTKLLGDSDTEIAAAVISALGNIANRKAAKALLAFLSEAPEALRPTLTDAILVCAERLFSVGKRTDAENLYRSLATAAQQKHVQQAAARGLESCREYK